MAERLSAFEQLRGIVVLNVFFFSPTADTQEIEKGRRSSNTSSQTKGFQTYAPTDAVCVYICRGCIVDSSDDHRSSGCVACMMKIMGEDSRVYRRSKRRCLEEFADYSSFPSYESASQKVREMLDVAGVGGVYVQTLQESPLSTEDLGGLLLQRFFRLHLIFLRSRFLRLPLVLLLCHLLRRQKRT